MHQVRGEELLFSDAGTVNISRSPAGELTARMHHSDSPEEVLAGIQGTSLWQRVSSHLRTGRLT